MMRVQDHSYAVAQAVAQSCGHRDQQSILMFSPKPILKKVMLALLLAVWLTTNSVPAAVLESAIPTNSAAWQGSAGLFVGVRQFEPDSGLGQLRYTTEDAVALAYAFTVELKLLPPKNVWLALSGQPESQKQKNNLQTLRRMGVNETTANRDDLLSVTKLSVKRASDPNGLFIAAFTTHGYESGGRLFLMPANGSASDIETMGVPMESIRTSISRAIAAKRLLFIDACRQSVMTEVRGDTRMSEAFYKALYASSNAFGQLISCSPGQQSYENESLGHGVFTFHLLEALRGGATANPRDGFIYFREVADYTTKKTSEFVSINMSMEQNPSFSGDTAAMSFPLAIDPAQLNEIKELRSQADAALIGIREAARAHQGVMSPEMLGRLSTRLDESVGTDLQRLVKKCQAVVAQKNDRESLVDFVAWFRGAFNQTATMPESRAVAIDPIIPKVASSRAGPTHIFQSKSGTSGHSEKASIQIQFDQRSRHNSHLWTQAVEARFRDHLAQAFRESSSFTVRAESADTWSSRQNTNTKTDYLLTIRVDEFSHNMEQRQIGSGLLKMATGSYTPKSKLTVGWGLTRNKDNLEVKTDSLTSVASGKSITPNPNQNVSVAALSNQAEWPDTAALSELARKLGSAAAAAVDWSSRQ